MRRSWWCCLWLALGVGLWAQLPKTPAQQQRDLRQGVPPPKPPPVLGQKQPQGQTPATPDQTQPAAPAGTPAPPSTRQNTPSTVVYGGLNFRHASLTKVIDMLARQLKINYILDPAVKGGVILNTYGETKDIDTRSLLEAILRINGAGMVQQGNLYRIVPLANVSHLALEPEQQDEKTIPDDDKEMLNLVFLKYTTADELAKVLQPFIGEYGQVYSYAPANLLMILDSRRGMRR